MKEVTNERAFREAVNVDKIRKQGLGRKSIGKEAVTTPRRDRLKGYHLGLIRGNGTCLYCAITSSDLPKTITRMNNEYPHGVTLLGTRFVGSKKEGETYAKELRDTLVTYDVKSNNFWFACADRTALTFSKTMSKLAPTLHKKRLAKRQDLATLGLDPVKGVTYYDYDERLELRLLDADFPVRSVELILDVITSLATSVRKPLYIQTKFAIRGKADIVSHWLLSRGFTYNRGRGKAPGVRARYYYLPEGANHYCTDKRVPKQVDYFSV